jgi:SAM-dependent methyltransferase
MGSGVGTYYDRLGRWNRLARAFGYGGGAGTLTVHRALADPKTGGRGTFTRLHDILLEHLPAAARPRVLDAGCGLGGTMIGLARALDATCVGLTVSETQAHTANRAAERMGLASKVRARVQSYDAPPDETFDIIVAIESLAHSANPSRSVAALASVIAPGGCIAVIDDMPEPAAAGSPDLEAFKTGWHCPVLWSAPDYRLAFDRLGLDVVADRDLTADCRPRPSWRIALLMWLNRVVRLVPLTGLRQVMDAHYGGLALERLIRRRMVSYRLCVARRPAVQVS